MSTKAEHATNYTRMAVTVHKQLPVLSARNLASMKTRCSVLPRASALEWSVMEMCGALSSMAMIIGLSNNGNTGRRFRLQR